MSASERSPLTRLLLFIICLAVLGTLIALAWYFSMDLPARQALLHVPLNAIPTPVDGQVT